MWYGSSFSPREYFRGATAAELAAAQLALAAAELTIAQLALAAA